MDRFQDGNGRLTPQHRVRVGALEEHDGATLRHGADPMQQRPVASAVLQPPQRVADEHEEIVLLHLALGNLGVTNIPVARRLNACRDTGRGALHTQG
jgi:hypothetical protein